MLAGFTGLRQRNPSASEAHWNTAHQYALTAAHKDPIPRDIFRVSQIACCKTVHAQNSFVNLQHQVYMTKLFGHSEEN